MLRWLRVHYLGVEPNNHNVHEHLEIPLTHEFSHFPAA